MKYTAISVFCLALAGIIVIYEFRPANDKTVVTSRKITPIEQHKYELKPISKEKDNVIHHLQTDKGNNIKQPEKINYEIIKRNVENNNTVKQEPSLIKQTIVNDDVPKFAKKLRTTYVNGIYCQQVADDGTYRHQKHYFYDQKKEIFVEIPNVYFVDNTDKLGNLKEEYLKYGSKTDEITYRGQRIKIWTME